MDEPTGISSTATPKMETTQRSAWGKALELRTSVVEEALEICEENLNGFQFEMKILVAQINILNDWISSQFGVQLINKDSKFYKYLNHSNSTATEEIQKITNDLTKWSTNKATDDDKVTERSQRKRRKRTRNLNEPQSQTQSSKSESSEHSEGSTESPGPRRAKRRARAARSHTFIVEDGGASDRERKRKGKDDPDFDPLEENFPSQSESEPSTSTSQSSSDEEQEDLSETEEFRQARKRRKRRDRKQRTKRLSASPDAGEEHSVNPELKRRLREKLAGRRSSGSGADISSADQHGRNVRQCQQSARVHGTRASQNALSDEGNFFNVADNLISWSQSQTQDPLALEASNAGYFCGYCRHKFGTRDLVDNHLLQVHAQELPAPIMRSGQKSKFNKIRKWGRKLTY